MAPKKAVPEPAAVAAKGSESEISDSKPDIAVKSSSAAAQKTSSHPSTMEMVKEALKELDSRKGVSAQAVRGYIKTKYPSTDESRLKSLVRRALTKGIDTGVLVRPAHAASMTGAQGRFRLAPKAKGAKARSKENTDPNEKSPDSEEKSTDPEEKKAPKPKKPKEAKAKGEESSKEKSGKKMAADDTKPKATGKGASASKVAPAKKPKAKASSDANRTPPGAAKAPKAGKAKAPKATKGAAEEPAGKKKAAPRSNDGDSAGKAPGRRGKK
ncbi:hypothetical protein DNTS_032456 [Danionella cerebrum]|uniref:H15 domain-containing protein n=1 Tax=Danionella cerebrum TaxID=2873325 RepID=A0A553QEA0_9TELE|nr:hypothetical protein DNTS_032456 [Danionella translucida]